MIAAIASVITASAPYTAASDSRDEATPVLESNAVRLYRVSALRPPQSSEEFPRQGNVQLAVSLSFLERSDRYGLHQHCRPRHLPQPNDRMSLSPLFSYLARGLHTA